MEKPKIEEISSKEYEEGRIDKFSLSGKEDIHSQLIPFLISLGFSEKNLEELDIDTSEDIEGYFFIFEEGMRFHLLILEEGINMILDTRIPKEELISKIENYFQIF